MGCSGNSGVGERTRSGRRSTPRGCEAVGRRRLCAQEFEQGVGEGVVVVAGDHVRGLGQCRHGARAAPVRGNASTVRSDTRSLRPPLTSSTGTSIARAALRPRRPAGARCRCTNSVEQARIPVPAPGGHRRRGAAGGPAVPGSCAPGGAAGSRRSPSRRARTKSKPSGNAVMKSRMRCMPAASQRGVMSTSTSAENSAVARLGHQAGQAAHRGADQDGSPAAAAGWRPGTSSTNCPAS